jgi:hypothetical protein
MQLAKAAAQPLNLGIEHSVDGPNERHKVHLSHFSLGLHSGSNEWISGGQASWSFKTQIISGKPCCSVTSIRIHCSPPATVWKFEHLFEGLKGNILFISRKWGMSSQFATLYQRSRSPLCLGQPDTKRPSEKTLCFLL